MSGSAPADTCTMRRFRSCKSVPTTRCIGASRRTESPRRGGSGSDGFAITSRGVGGFTPNLPEGKTKSPWLQERPWLLRVPKRIREQAVLDVKDAYNSNFAKMKVSGQNFRFELRLKTAKDDRQTIAIPKECFLGSRAKNPPMWTNNVVGSGLGGLDTRDDWFEDHRVEAECRLVYDRRVGTYTLQVPVEIEHTLPYAKRPLVSIDPGVRTFLTYYTPDGETGEIGKGLRTIHRQFGAIDKISGLIKRREGNHQRLRHLRRARRRIYNKVKYLTDEIHWKAAAFLCGNFDTVLLPEFGAAAMLKKRGLSSRTKRDMQAWSHGRFRERMLHKARETRARVVVCGEAYTSKTCGHCGCLNSTTAWGHPRPSSAGSAAASSIAT